MSPPRVRIACLWALCLALAGLTQASEVIEHRVSSEDGRYYVYVEMEIDADVEAVYRVLTDYEHLAALNDSIVTSHVLQREGDTARVLVVSEGCIWIFCREIRQVQEVTPMRENTLILSRTDPEVSDLKHGRVLWDIRARDKGTRIIYSGDFAPDFWVPPFVGTALLRQRLLEEAKKTIRGIEKVIANE